MFSLQQVLIKVLKQSAHTRIQTPSHVHANSHQQIFVSLQENDDLVIITYFHYQISNEIAHTTTCSYDDG
jgi:hypothetical protein